MKTTMMLAVFICSLTVYAAAQTLDEVNKANNPLTPMLTLNLQDLYVDSYYHLGDSDSNSLLLRGVLPHKLFGWPQILRATVAGDDDRPTQNTLQSQPFVIYNLPKGFYLRSTATWNFDLQHGDFYIPLGLGAGKVWKLKSSATLNVFAEPQWTVAHEGVAPKFQVFTGLNMQFPL